MSASQRVAGALTFDTVPALYRDSAAWFAAGGDLIVDLGQVTRADSAGLALLVEWLRRARAGDARLHLANIPEQVLTLIRVNGLQDILGNPPAAR
jgi:phospholipid transport system transporter-binding protein